MLDLRKMVFTKKALVKVVESLPNRIDISNFIYRLYVIKEIELAERDIKKGRVYSHSQVLREVKKWFKSNPQFSSIFEEGN